MYYNKDIIAIMKKKKINILFGRKPKYKFIFYRTNDMIPSEEIKQKIYNMLEPKEDIEIVVKETKKWQKIIK